VVLGHSTYYPKFGFQAARAYGITSQWKVPDNVFMVRVLDEQKMSGVAGQVLYRPEFGSVS
jgi:predicted N-acetyltransferase YhbS